jgi:hypothetical protein
MSDAKTGNWVMNDLRKALLTKAADGKVGAIPETLSAPTRETLNHLVDFIWYYDPAAYDLPDKVEESEMYAWLLTRLESQLVWDATERSHITRMRGIAGPPEGDALDVSAFPLLDVVRKLFRPDDRDHMLNLVVYAPPPPTGPTGVGKTDFAYTLIEGAQMVHPDGISASSNNTSDPFEDTESWSGLEAWLERTSGPKVFLWDEAAQTLMFDDMNTGMALSKLIRLLRKYNCHLILIAHTGKDIPLDIRRMVLFALKESKKKAVIGAGLEEDSAGWMQIKNVLYTLRNIPATTIEYDSLGDKGSFVFDDGLPAPSEPEEEEDPVTCGDNGGRNKRGNPCRTTAAEDPMVAKTGRCKHHPDDDEDDEGGD